NKKTNLQTWEISASSKQLRDSNENPKERKTEMSFLLKLSRTVFLRKTIYGLLALIDKVFSRQEQVIVLCYHSIGEGDFYFSTSQAEFKKQIDLLIKKGYDSLSPTDFQSWLENGAEKLSTPKFLLTFDDGYRDVLAIKDFLREKGIKPIMFVLSDEEKVSKEELGAEKSLLSKEEILELKKNGWEIGSHGATHGDFEKMGRGELENEIAGSKKKLEEKLGFAIDYFAYPKGVYDKTILDLVASAGYKLAFSMDDGSIFFQTNRYTIPRIGINKSHSSGEFLAVFSLTVIKFRVIIKKIFYLIKSEK
ncbi:MAG: polysaccharide deacetylase family protein, partial [Patescibacteria group bacterium]|nr:polysaccharide deacetylase family protein [Patescibacteria group bacterium]